MPADKRPIINCHTHIFSGDHVPPFLARSYVPWPFYFLFPLNVIVWLFRGWFKIKDAWVYSSFRKYLQRVITGFATAMNFFEPLTTMILYLIFIESAVILLQLLVCQLGLEAIISCEYINVKVEWLSQYYLFWPIASFNLRLVFVIVVFICLPFVRNLIVALLKIVLRILSKLPGKHTKELFHRYLNIGRYAFNKKQTRILQKLLWQYPDDTQVIVLPMDMEYMKAFRPPKRYRDQMTELAHIKMTSANKTRIFPFVFADPRRMVPLSKEKRTREGDQVYFDYEILPDGKVELKPCFMKTLIEENGFRGIKIYPALGYYPFDEKLLPLWKYAADNNIPIMTHCIRGTIFYRGIKKKAWNNHPVFCQAMGKKHGKPVSERLHLPQMNNVDFSYNFTNPLNYLCLLEERYLRKVICNALEQKNADPRLKELFGYVDVNTPLQSDLSALKICLGHFGGDDEWKRFFEMDRYVYSSKIITNPEKGLELRGMSEGTTELTWKYVDWYSIVCSLILEHPNVYADISYILHSTADTIPLLKQTLENPKLRNKVLYGTDFFVVRNHKSDKNMSAEYKGGLSDEDFDQIARNNPRVYLETKIHGPV